jgi:hypothetical protein
MVYIVDIKDRQQSTYFRWKGYLSSQNVVTYFPDVIAGHNSENTSLLTMLQLLYQIYFETIIDPLSNVSPAT